MEAPRNIGTVIISILNMESVDRGCQTVLTHPPSPPMPAPVAKIDSPAPLRSIPKGARFLFAVTESISGSDETRDLLSFDVVKRVNVILLGGSFCNAIQDHFLNTFHLPGYIFYLADEIACQR